MIDRLEYLNREKGLKFQAGTERVKLLNSEVTKAPTAWKTAVDMYNVATTIGYKNPLIQYRCILPQGEEGGLLSLQEDVQSQMGDNTRVWVPGGIPYSIDGENFGLYYLQIASSQRLAFRSQNPQLNVLHGEAVAKGIEGRSNTPHVAPSNIQIATVLSVDGQIVQLSGGDPIKLSEDELTRQLIEAHTVSFAFPHDAGQREREGIHGILGDNPMIIGYDQDQHRLAGVGYLEVDKSFHAHKGKVALIEPTYLTIPGYQGQGVSRCIRVAAQELFAAPGEQVYGGRSAIVFNESIRGTSFPLSLKSGCDLPTGFGNNKMDGDLGGAYTHIGPANPNTGLMPFGLSYHKSNELKIKQHACKTQ